MLFWFISTRKTCKSYRTTRDCHLTNTCILILACDLVIAWCVVIAGSIHIAIAITIFPSIIVIGLGSLVNGTHITQVTAAIDIALDSTATDGDISISTHASGLCKRGKTTSTTKGATINSTTFYLYFSVVIYKTALTTTKDGTLDCSAFCDGHVSRG